MKYLTLIFIILLSGCVHHSHDSRYDSPYLLIWDDGYSIRMLNMHSLEECLKHGYRIPQARFKCIPEKERQNNVVHTRLNVYSRILIK